MLYVTSLVEGEGDEIAIGTLLHRIGEAIGCPIAAEMAMISRLIRTTSGKWR